MLMGLVLAGACGSGQLVDDRTPASQPTDGNHVQDPLCSGAGMKAADQAGRVDRIVAAYPSDVKTMIAFQDSGRDVPGGPGAVNSSLQSRRADEKVSLCIYDGVFNYRKGPPPPESGTPGPPVAPTRVSYLVFEDDSVVIDSFGPNTYPATGPSPTP
jgi:hypothetical protein